MYFGFNIFDRVISGGFLRPGEKEVIQVKINVNTANTMVTAIFPVRLAAPGNNPSIFPIKIKKNNVSI